MTSLIVEQELSPSRFAEVGRPVGAYRRDDGEVVAIVSNLDLLYWSARGIYEGHRIRHRVSLYRGAHGPRLAVFDEARFPINEVAFHPTQPVLALATGAYDGGRDFEGELVLWDWESGATTRVLAESREVTRVRYLDDDRLAVLLRPRDDEEYGEAAARTTFVGGVLADLRPFADLGLKRHDRDPRLAGFAPIEPRALGFDHGATSQDGYRDQRDAILGPGFEPRHRVWDVAWLDDDQVAACHDRCHIEAWRTSSSGDRTLDVRGPGHGVQLLDRRPGGPGGPGGDGGGGLVVHVLTPCDPDNRWAQVSALWRLVDRDLVPLRRFDHYALCAVDRRGRLLCRDTGPNDRGRVRHDRVLAADDTIVLDTDLGHYDCFNHHLRVDGGDALYYLRATPASSHEHKVLARIDGDGAISEVTPWDGADDHLMCSSATLLPDGALVRSCRIYHPHPGHFAAFLERVELPTGAPGWRRPVDALVTSLVALADRPWLIYALTDGRVGLVDWRTGALLTEEPLRIDGVATMVMALAVRGDRIAAGTNDGRILILRVAAA